MGVGGYSCGRRARAESTRRGLRGGGEHALADSSVRASWLAGGVCTWLENGYLFVRHSILHINILVARWQTPFELDWSIRGMVHSRDGPVMLHSPLYSSI